MSDHAPLHAYGFGISVRLSYQDAVERTRAALKQVEEEILKGHAARCVAHAIKSGNTRDQTEKFSELVELFSRYGK